MEAAYDSIPLWHLAVLAAVQGITEFLPISSSAHLILVPYIAGWKDQGLLLDVAMHIGSLFAVVLYFRDDMRRLVMGGCDVLRGKRTSDSVLALQIVLATLPVVFVGFLLRQTIANEWRSPILIAAMTAAFALAGC